jgi:hypothetical protein
LNAPNAPGKEHQTSGRHFKTNLPCLLCLQQKYNVSQELLIAEFGAVALWQAQKLHEDEGHEQGVPTE